MAPSDQAVVAGSTSGRARSGTVRYRCFRHRLVGVRSRLSDRYGTDLLILTCVPIDWSAWTRGCRWVLIVATKGEGRPERGGAAVAKSDRISRVAGPPMPWRLLVALVIALVVGAVGCSDDDSASTSTTSEPGRSSTSASTTTTVAAAEVTTSSTSTTPVGASVEDEIIARYIGYWNARFAANSDTPNPNDPGVARVSWTPDSGGDPRGGRPEWVVQRSTPPSSVVRPSPW